MDERVSGTFTRGVVTVNSNHVSKERESLTVVLSSQYIAYIDL